MIDAPKNLTRNILLGMLVGFVLGAILYYSNFPPLRLKEFIEIYVFNLGSRELEDRGLGLGQHLERLPPHRVLALGVGARVLERRERRPELLELRGRRRVLLVDERVVATNQSTDPDMRFQVSSVLPFPPLLLLLLFGIDYRLSKHLSGCQVIW